MGPRDEDDDDYSDEDGVEDEDRDFEEDGDFDLDDERNPLIDGVGFADPGGRSALRAATRDNPRNLPCPTCGEPDKLTPIDVAKGYQCDRCANAAEGGY